MIELFVFAVACAVVERRRALRAELDQSTWEIRDALRSVTL